MNTSVITPSVEAVDSTLTKMNAESQKELSKVEYWEKRYATEDAEPESYEWFKKYANLKPFLTKHMPSPDAQPRILHLGCGTSTLTSDLFHAGYRDQANIDFSPKAIEIMESRHHDLDLEWQVMDVREMKYPDDSFEIAIDKGTLDAMLHGSLWDPEPDVMENTKAYIDEVRSPIAIAVAVLSP